MDDSLHVNLLKNLGDKLESYGVQAIDLIKEQAPILWQIVRHRIIAESIGVYITTLLLTIISFLLLKICCKDEWYSDGLITIFIGASIATFVMIIVSIFITVDLLSLDYATFSKIIRILK